MFGLLAGLHASFTFRRSFDTEKTNFENNFMVKERNMFIDSGSGFYSVENSFFTRRNKGRKFEVYQMNFIRLKEWCPLKRICCEFQEFPR